MTRVGKAIKKKISVITREQVIIRVPKALVELAAVNKNTEMEFSINRKGLLEIKQVEGKSNE